MAATDDNMADYMELDTNIASSDQAALIVIQMHGVRTDLTYTTAWSDAERSRYTLPLSTLGSG